MKKIVFVSGTRADFSKIKSLMMKVENSNEFELFIFVTGMHMSKKFGSTYMEIEKCGFKNIYKYINHDKYYQMDKALSSTIDGFSKFIHEIEPDLIVVHGDRVEPLAAAIVGSLNNILVAHIEGGELSGTIDESLRHAISKLAHIHLVNDEIAKKRLIQMGEDEKSIFIIGSPDLELLNNTISLDEAKKYYDIKFKNYAIAIFHPITTEINSLYKQSEEFVNALIKSEKNYIVIYPNNDLGFELILQNYERLKNNERFKIFPSLRFEYFISLLKNANFIIGNSSCIIKEALYLNVNGILVGSRQDGRTGINKTIRVNAEEKDILEAILNTSKCTNITNKRLEILNSSEQFYRLLKNNILFTINKQKIFMDKK
ncbi:UDP-N-acetylglucosamine 2-epimerase (hydrolyzing) [Campylobacter coli]|uniref:UDP-N-acetylglucosamine 2-epimerase n=1 Tax=Campylobacter coli TaxID=195 RepID=UPI00093093E8|nr:UDP-N-acetylglucosamine 2-epimerase [Campylobacter coli]EGK8092359.1 UDP-N-acetylglucosamine 2-epimerase (hydrolyzing) [Campylobacter lari]EAC2141140.1 UDP-N-acetylglucosamine 2-epimerase (hydrolyzing) [Campylobacter coli]EAH4950588.1 UDP-N-acetylglucosamine 2-epimerase (hydrolyzing) [Campylobacter coli]EAH5496268.1 UDP-N-acetylglucosamine 2-epimerase (hydrolyzing) [Campylobacter coli]EAH6675872.1 UDP-N-acetylglucosamine 2-epimerase (hydrolyzing) [Campylobacter coli]